MYRSTYMAVIPGSAGLSNQRRLRKVDFSESDIKRLQVLSTAKREIDRLAPSPEIEPPAPCGRPAGMAWRSTAQPLRHAAVNAYCAACAAFMMPSTVSG